MAMLLEPSEMEQHVNPPEHDLHEDTQQQAMSPTRSCSGRGEAMSRPGGASTAVHRKRAWMGRSAKVSGSLASPTTPVTSERSSATFNARTQGNPEPLTPLKASRSIPVANSAKSRSGRLAASTPTPRALASTYGVHSFPFGSTEASAETAAYCVKVIWPKLLLNNREDIQAWFQAYCQHRIIHHAFFFASAVHSDILRDKAISSVSRQSLAHKAAAISLLNQTLSDLSTAEIEAAIITILCLACNELDDASLRAGVVLPFEPHMPNTSWVSVYGRMDHIQAHARAMYLLVQRAGGLKGLNMPALGATIAFGDLNYAASHFTKPAFECFWVLDHDVVLAHRSLATSGGSTPGRGFFTKVPGRLPSKALSILVRLATIDRYMSECRRRLFAEDEEVRLIETRNALLHAFYRLPSFEELADEDKKGVCRLMYDCCRMAAALYANSVIYALPPHLGWHIAFVEQLQAVLGVVDFDSTRHELIDVLIWSLSVGGIAAYRTQYRAFFEVRLKKLLVRRKITAWSKVDRINEEFLWSESACKHGAAMLWLALR